MAANLFSFKELFLFTAFTVTSLTFTQANNNSVKNTVANKPLNQYMLNNHQRFNIKAPTRNTRLPRL